MKKIIALFIVIASVITTAICAVTPIEKTRIKYLEIQGISDSDSAKYYLSDIDEILFTISNKYTMVRLKNNSFTSPVLLNEQNERIDFRFVYAEEDEILPPTIIVSETKDQNLGYISWKPVSDAIGYELRYVKERPMLFGDIDWDNANSCDGCITVGPDCTEISVDSLHYGSTYYFAVRSVGNNGRMSEWSQRLPNFKENKGLKITTAERAIPTLITAITNRRRDGFTIKFDLTFNSTDYSAEEVEELQKYYTITNGKFVADKLLLKNINSQQKTYVELTDKHPDDGEITISGLENESWYEIAFINSTKSVEADALYDIVNIRITETPSLDEYVGSLGAEYSMFKEWYDASFNKELIGVKDFTLLLPSDQVINSALDDVHRRLECWGMTRDEDVLRQWIMEVLFFVGNMPADKLMANETTDYYSVYNCQYRTSAQQLSGETVKVENGIVYPIDRLHIPGNVLIYRLKDWFYHYETCYDYQKEEYFKLTNIRFRDVNTAVFGWTPLPDVWPLHECRVLNLEPEPECGVDNFRFDFTPIKSSEDENGNTSINPYLIPPGTYRLTFGSKMNQNISIRASVLVNNMIIANTDGDIFLGSGMHYHYDRGATVDNCYPEGYDPIEVREIGGDSKAGNYDTDGGLLISEIVIPDVNGDGSPVPIVIRFEGDSWNSQSSFTFNHWCLRPTADFY